MEKRITTSWKRLGITNDFLFGKVMQNPVLCKKLLQRIFPDLNIDYVEYPELQKEIKLDKDAKSIRLDVYVKDGNGTVFAIEMQMIDTKELPKRTRYYQGMMDLQLLEKGDTYRKLPQTYIIFICPFDLFGKGRHLYTFENFCKEEKGLALLDGTVKIFLNADSSRRDTNKELRAFLDYVAGKPSEDSFVKELEAALQEAKKNREWRHEYMTLEMRDRENLEIGREEGRREGAILERILVYKETGLSDEIIMRKLKERFHLSKKEARRYIQESVQYEI
ncbi:MAG: Rpn family recombination-promoting nuclease/putative transposase [Lachnospiraceae bacterium]|jgi:predicted transposase/invertase (TIGR01784 family)|nr:Rpn family recombination-promoting nuclease/putative transposase [Lachnospiraceae bacterium]